MKKELTNEIVEEYEVSITRACKMMEIHRSYFYYREKRDDTEVEEAIRKAAEHGDGFWKIKDFREWCEGNDIKILFTQPGCPTQNGYIERFNGSYRRAVLDAYIFRTIEEVRQRTEVWNEYYNYERPHESLGNKTPMEFSKRRNDQDTSVVVRSCKDSPCPTPRQGYTSVLRTALTRRFARPFKGITGQQRQKNIEKIILNDIF